MPSRRERVEHTRFQITDFSVEEGELVHSGSKDPDERHLVLALDELSRAALWGATWETYPYAYPQVRSLARTTAIEYLPVIEWALKKHGEDAKLSVRALCVVAGVLQTVIPSQYDAGRRLIQSNVPAINEGIERFPKWEPIFRAALKTLEQPTDGKKMSYLTVEVWEGWSGRERWHIKKR